MTLVSRGGGRLLGTGLNLEGVTRSRTHTTPHQSITEVKPMDASPIPACCPHHLARATPRHAAEPLLPGEREDHPLQGGACVDCRASFLSPRDREKASCQDPVTFAPTLCLCGKKSDHEMGLQSSVYHGSGTPSRGPVPLFSNENVCTAEELQSS